MQKALSLRRLAWLRWVAWGAILLALLWVSAATVGYGLALRSWQIEAASAPVSRHFNNSISDRWSATFGLAGWTCFKLTGYPKWLCIPPEFHRNPDGTRANLYAAMRPPQGALVEATNHIVRRLVVDTPQGARTLVNRDWEESVRLTGQPTHWWAYVVGALAVAAAAGVVFLTVIGLLRSSSTGRRSRGG